MPNPATTEIQTWPIEKFIPYLRNPRKNDGVVDQMRASIQEFGFKIPMLARSDGTVVDGHLRLKAAKSLGLPELPVILCDEWTEAQVKAFRLMVNRSVTWASWDVELLAVEMLDLKGLDFNLALTGFETKEIDGFTLAANPAEDEVPPVPEVPITKPGDLWLLGDHRLLCGNSTDADSVSLLLGERKPFLMVTDPPYGVEYDPTWRDGKGDFNAPKMRGKVSNDDTIDWTPAFKLFLGDVAYLWHAGVFAGQIADHASAAGFQIRAQIIWKKQHFVFGRGAYHWGHEPCWYVVRNGRPSHWGGDRKQSTVWDVANLNPMGGNHEEKRTGHGTQKPVEIMRRPILNHTKPGDEVYDPFLGSGTTLIAAEATGRICYGLEISPAYCDVIVLRWEKLTGKAARLEAAGCSFAEAGRGRRQKAEDDIAEECETLLAGKDDPAAG